MRKQVKAIAAVMSAIMLAVSLAGCGNTAPAKEKETSQSTGESQTVQKSESQSEEAKEPVTIKWMHHFSEEARIAWAQEVADKTTEKYPWITVEIEVQPYDRYVATLKTKIQSDDAPDLYNVQSRALLQEFVDAGYCADLSGEEFLSSIMEPGIDAGRIGDKVYSLVQDMGGAIVFYNTELFDEKGISVPTTYTEWKDILTKLEGEGIAPIAAGYQEVWALLVDTWSDYVPALFDDNTDWAVDKMSGKEKFTGDAEFAAAMTRIYERSKYTQKDAFGTDWNKACELVATGKAAMVIGGFFALDAIQSKNPDIKLGAFALPISDNPEDTKTPLGNAGGFIVHEGPNKEAAARLLEVMFSEEMASKYQTLARTISTVKNINSDLEPALKDILDVEAKGLAVSTSSLEYTFSGEYQKVYVTELVNFLMADKLDIDKLCEALDKGFAAQ